MLICPETELSQNVENYITPLVVKFNCNFDELVENFLSDSITRYLILPDCDDVADMPIDDSFSAGIEDAERSMNLSRLVKLLGMISCPVRRAKSALMLLQLPATSETPSKAPSPSGRNSSVVELINIAESCVSTQSGIKDGLIEAIRMYQLKALAGRYNVCNIDIRDARQVRATVGIITSQIRGPSGELVIKKSLEDAVKFAGAWGAASVDISAVYGRALIHCAGMVSETCATRAISREKISGGRRSGSMEGEEINRVRVEAIQSVLASVPRSRLVNVTEDVCTYIFSVLHDTFLSSDSGFLSAGKLYTAILFTLW